MTRRLHCFPPGSESDVNGLREVEAHVSRVPGANASRHRIADGKDSALTDPLFPAFPKILRTQMKLQTGRCGETLWAPDSRTDGRHCRTGAAVTQELFEVLTRDSVKFS